MDTPQSLAERMFEDGQKTIQFFDHLSPDQWQMVVYSEGSRWTIRQVLGHFVSAEVSFTRLMENILAGGAGAPEDFDIDAYNEKKVAQLQSASTSELLLQYQQARQRNVELVSGLSPAELAIEGRHPFLGVVPLTDIIKLIYRHNQIHLRDVRKLLSLAF
jgi:hypothetical protein